MHLVESSPDLSCYRADFPLLQRQLNGKPIVYLDSAATALKPQAVIDAVTRFYTECTSNVRRGVHVLSEEASDRFESARERIARFINADAREIVFVRSATEALNVVASSLPANAVIASNFSEHHSNLLPWRTRNVITLQIDTTGRIDVEHAAARLASGKPALITFSSISNAFGVRQPVDELVHLARSAGAMVMVDVSQSIGHEPVDVRALDCDFLCFSGHKMLGPSGVGVLYVRNGMEKGLRPILLGGAMVKSVDLKTHTPLPFPWLFEAGTPNIEGILGLAAACDYLDTIGVETIREHNALLARRLRNGLESVERVTLYGSARHDSPIVAFSVADLEADGVARILSNRYAVMVRSGFHCAQPLHLALKLPGTVRASVHLYNTEEEMDVCSQALEVIAALP